MSSLKVGLKSTQLFLPAPQVRLDERRPKMLQRRFRPGTSEHIRLLGFMVFPTTCMKYLRKETVRYRD
jgi:hypothetical protein